MEVITSAECTRSTSSGAKPCGASQPGGCLWLTDATATSNIFTVGFSQLRAAPGWSTFNPQPEPVIHIGEVQSVLESRLGDSFHGSAAY